MRGSIQTRFKLQAPRLGRFPQHPFTYDKYSSAANGIFAWYPMTAFARQGVPVKDYVGGRHMTLVDTLEPNWKVHGYDGYNKSNNRWGQYIKPWGDGADFRYQATFPALGANWSIFIWGNQNTNTCFGLNDSVGNNHEIFLSEQDTLTWFFRESAQQSFAITPSGYDNDTEAEQYNPGGAMLAFVRNGNADRKVYLNGDEIGSDTTSADPVYDEFFFGYQLFYNDTRNAGVYEIRVYNRSMSPGEVKSVHYNRLKLYSPLGSKSYFIVGLGGGTPVENSVTSSWEAEGIAQAALTCGHEGKAPVSQELIVNWESRLRFEIPRISSHEAKGSVFANHTSRYEAHGPAVSSRATSYEAKGPAAVLPIPLLRHHRKIPIYDR